jgi:hypothetical protein
VIVCTPPTTLASLFCLVDCCVEAAVKLYTYPRNPDVKSI